MRKNLVTMLDELGTHELLGLRSTEDLFSGCGGLLFATSALLFPVFVGDELRNFGGNRKMMSQRLFQEMIEAFLAPRLASMPEALVIPLGISVEAALEWLAARGEFDTARMLKGFPHPSGANGHRARIFRSNAASLRAQMVTWFASRSPGNA